MNIYEKLLSLRRQVRIVWLGWVVEWHMARAEWLGFKRRWASGE